VKVGTLEPQVLKSEPGTLRLKEFRHFLFTKMGALGKFPFKNYVTVFQFSKTIQVKMT